MKIDEIWVVTSVATDYSVRTEVYGDEETSLADAKYNKEREDWKAVWVDHVVLSDWVDQDGAMREDKYAYDG